MALLSGTPYSDLAGNVPVAPYNNHRDPPFFRLDLRLAFIAVVQNATLSTEATPFAQDCARENGSFQCHHTAFGPITIPSIGVEAAL